MRKTTIFATFLLLTAHLFAQQTVYDTITAGGLQRNYILYVPASYTPGTEVPLVFNFHGYTSNALQQFGYGDFTDIADTAGFIVCHPNGTLDANNTTHWNVGWGGSSVDDVAFVDQLIDSLAADYSINLDRVYSTGMSNGGFMSYQLACQLSGRIAAIASVTGSMTSGLPLTCSPTRPVAIMEIHGTADGVVPYNGATGFEAISDVLDFWIGFNNCDTAATVTNMPNIAPLDGSTADYFYHGNGDQGVSVEHYRINSGGHTWPGASIVIGVTNFDIIASVEIWRFFNKYDLNGSLVSRDQIANEEHSKISLFPNPTESMITIRTQSPETQKIEILNSFGQSMFISTVGRINKQLDFSSYPSGIYFVKVGTQVHKVIKR